MNNLLLEVVTTTATTTATLGNAIGYIGLALCVALCGVGSAMGLYYTGQAGAGVLAEDPKKFSKVLVMVVLPATQGIYGFVLAIVGQSYIDALTVSQGISVLFACMPLALLGLFSAIYQGKTATAGIYALAKEESLSGKLILFPAMVETYAILGLVISLLLLQAI